MSVEKLSWLSISYKMNIDMEKLKRFLEAFSGKNAIASFSAMPLEGSLWEAKRTELEKALSGINTEDYPGYFKKTFEMRKDPLKLFPWAKSFFMFAIPFEVLPAASDDIKPSDSEWKAGLVSGYALKTAYHSHANGVTKSFKDELEIHTGMSFTAESCVDTKPVSEKILAELSGLGKNGLNSCLLCGDKGSGCFIASLFTDIRLDYLLNSDNVPQKDCSQCQSCVRICPVNAISEGKPFDIARCVSYLCGEKRGVLNKAEIESIGSWIFGCGLCVINCPSSTMPKEKSIDLEWLLMSPSAQIKKAITGTPLEHVGLTQLRRNAIYVLANKKNTDAVKLIRDFRKIQNSPLLESIISEIID